MNIKSELRSSSKLFKVITNFKFTEILTANVLFYSLLVGISLGMFIVGIGDGATVTRLTYIVVALFVTALVVDDYRSSNKEKSQKFKQYGLFIILSILFSEVVLFATSHKTSEYPIKIIVQPATRYIADGEETINGVKKKKTRKIEYQKAVFYNLDNNEEIGYRDIDKGEEMKLELITNITGKKIYVDYIPFLRYTEKFKYTRNQ